MKAWLGHAAKTLNPAAKAEGSRNATSKNAGAARQASADTAAATEFVVKQKKAPSPAGALEIPAAALRWLTLPAKIQELVLLVCDDDALWNLAKTSTQTRKLATELPSLPWRQTLLMRAAHDKLEGALVGALQHHLPALRHREKAFLLPATTSAATLQDIAALVDGSPQHPLLVVSNLGAWQDLGPIPAQIDTRVKYGLMLVSFDIRASLNIILLTVGRIPTGG